MGQEMKLTKAIIPTLPDGMHSDGNGLYLRVRGGSRSWIYRFQENGRKHDMGLGSAKTVSISMARKAVIELKVQRSHKRLDLRLNPRKSRPVDNPVFSKIAPEAVDNYLSVRKVGAARVKAIRRHLGFCTPIDNLPVRDITRDDILAIVKPMWSSMTPTAKGVLWAINMVLTYAKAKKMLEGDLPSTWRGNMDAFLAAPRKEHKVVHRAEVPMVDAPRVFQALLASSSPACQSLALGMATVLRMAEFTTATWDGVDLKEAVLTVPRTKGKDRPFRVPLAPQIVEWLGKSAKPDGLVFQTSQHAVRQAMKRLLPDATVHGIRATFSMWCADNGVDPYVRETCLTHTVDNDVAAAYQRSDLLERRRPVMSAWVAFLLTAPASRQSGCP